MLEFFSDVVAALSAAIAARETNSFTLAMSAPTRMMSAELFSTTDTKVLRRRSMSAAVVSTSAMRTVRVGAPFFPVMVSSKSIPTQLRYSCEFRVNLHADQHLSPRFYRSDQEDEHQSDGKRKKIGQRIVGS